MDTQLNFNIIARTGTKSYSSREWELHRTTISELYQQGLRQKELLEILDKKHGFHPTYVQPLRICCIYYSRLRRNYLVPLCSRRESTNGVLIARTRRTISLQHSGFLLQGVVLAREHHFGSGDESLMRLRLIATCDGKAFKMLRSLQNRPLRQTLPLSYHLHHHHRPGRKVMRTLAKKAKMFQQVP